MVNYFDLMGLPIDFNVDNNQLDTTFRTLQSQFHPDIQKNSQNTKTPLIHVPSLANLTDEQAAAVINTAYQTLKYPDSRATHLLELSDQAEGLNDSIRDLDFLDRAMALRISLEEADSSELSNLKVQLDQWVHQVQSAFSKAYQSQNWQGCQVATQQLKFLIKLQRDFAKKADALAAEHHHNDDDLYV